MVLTRVVRPMIDAPRDTRQVDLSHQRASHGLARSRSQQSEAAWHVFPNKFSVVQTMSTESPNRLIDKCQSKSKLSPAIKPPDNDRSRIAPIRPRK
jgi:hypothetical protein